MSLISGVLCNNREMRSKLGIPVCAFLLLAIFALLGVKLFYKKEYVSLRQKMKEISQSESYKEKLGRSTWYFLHEMAAKFPDQPTLDDRERYFNFIADFSLLYPCQECSSHFQQLITKFQPVVSTKYPIFLGF